MHESLSLSSCTLSEIPYFLLPLKETKISEKQTALFECEISQPAALVQWYKDGIEIQPSTRIEIDADGQFHDLTIRNAVVEDEAEYAAEILISGERSSATLFVEGLYWFFACAFIRCWEWFL